MLSLHCSLQIQNAGDLTMIERRDTMEFFRDAAADQFRIHIRKPWLPRSGPMVNHKALTSAVLDSRKALDKRAWEKQRVFDPDGVSTEAGRVGKEEGRTWSLRGDEYR